MAHRFLTSPRGGPKWSSKPSARGARLPSRRAPRLPGCIPTWFGVQHSGYLEFVEIQRIAQRTVAQRRIFVNNLAIRRAIEELKRAKEQVCHILQSAFRSNCRTRSSVCWKKCGSSCRLCCGEERQSFSGRVPASAAPPRLSVRHLGGSSSALSSSLEDLA